MIEKLQSQVILQKDVIAAKDSKANNLLAVISEKDNIIAIQEKEKTLLKKKVRKSYILGALTGGLAGALIILVL